MDQKMNYQKKFFDMLDQTNFYLLPISDQQFIQKTAFSLTLTFQELRQLVEIALDLRMWDEGSIDQLWPYQNDNCEIEEHDRFQKKRSLLEVIERWEELKEQDKDYRNFNTEKFQSAPPSFVPVSEDDKVMGRCPVASIKTRCCNLNTIDVVRNCPLDCSYCCIQSFFDKNQVLIEKNLKSKLANLNLDRKKIYHFGTGQSSDSLVLGNKDGIMDALMDFARRNPNVILELKTKSKNVDYMLKNKIPRNVICTWTLNTDTIIENEEHRTANMQERLEAARKLADKNILVGFHFHPIVKYLGWQEEYGDLIDLTQKMFSPFEVVMVSFGTLTFIKSVINKIRRRKIKSKILQMPFEEVAGKLSYPFDVKKEIFSLAYNRYKAWHKKVFFYLCMEDTRLWPLVFGRDYRDNDEFEKDMLRFYMQKINHLKFRLSPFI